MLTSSTILITGAAVRIGKHIALNFADQGWNVAVHYNHSETQAIELMETLRKKGIKAECFKADLNQEQTYLSLFDQVNEKLGPVHCLVNNASTFQYDAALTATRESWDYHIEANLRAPFVLSQKFAQRLPEGNTGNIINILDQRVWNLTPHYTSYTVSKTALWTLTQTLALAFAPLIRVNGIGPGPTLANARQRTDDFQRQCQDLPLKSGATPEEIAKTIDFIIHTPSLTGQMIALDGGQHLGWAFPNQSFSVYD